MFSRQEVHVYQEKDGVIYDSVTADILHYWDKFMSGRDVLAVTPEGNYFLALLYTMFFTPRFYVSPISKAYAILLAAEHDAPGSTMARLSVEIFKPVESDEPYNLVSSETIWPKTTRLGWNTLLRNYDGRFWIFKSIDLLGVRSESAHPMTQKKAIAWAMRKGAWGRTMALLGLEEYI